MVKFVTGQFPQQIDWKQIEHVAENKGVLSGLEISLYATPATIQVASGTAFIASKKLSIPSQIISLTQDSTNPRKATIAVTTLAQAVLGDPEPATPSGASGLKTTRPRPPTSEDIEAQLGTSDYIVIGECWVPPAGTNMTTLDLFDKRYFVRLALEVEPRTTDPTGDELYDGRIWLRTDL